MSQSANKGLIFGIMMGTAGISLIIVWYQKIRKPGSMNLPKLLSLSNEFNSISLQDAVHNERGTVVLLQQSQFQILEKLNDLLMSVEELKEEVKFLKEAIPELEKYVRVELRGNTAMHRTTPQHQAARKKKAKPGRGISTSNSSEEAESEGGYVTAQSDTEKGHLFGHKASKKTAKRLSLPVLIEMVDDLHLKSDSDKQKGFELLCNHKNKYKDETEFMWRLVRAYGDMYELSTNMGEKKKYASDGKDLGERAVSQAPKNGYCHLWYGNICGLFAECGGLQNRVKYGHLFKEHIDKALELIPDEPLLYYLNGRYCYSVFKLNWMEKKMASTLFGMVPTSSIEDALNNFLKAEELKPGYSKYNYVYLAKCYKELGNKAKALMYCDAALLVSSDNKRDHEAQVELENVILSLKQI
ncbi:regulator of microtubule dynamics protein 2 isoform X3 [Sarcophilus harrisii]|uniref:regulator of microtubule dynamics protein 2 isoform X3 n=1 Tax=Sarcophilus harrisii TaxID=9305 RepID=UPI001301FF4B|nr:regulator of microtubule dynamics protein 2 isoform X3 [Sarcophilus harrisii]XP_031806215.1 regulator of microtubule dynamics protein 2 isoform X3 [Sarcophilus harrisii]XP_031806216.1 regulator of microtubule dynamics protein 2 isoform X3 [Sarcophilus harrisii]